MPDLKPGKTVVEGPGKIVLVQTTDAGKNRLYVLTCQVLGITFLTVQSHSYIGLLKKSVRKVTPKTITTFFSKLNLNLQSVFADNPEGTTQYFAALCLELVAAVRDKKIPNPAEMLEHLRNWKATLENGAPDPLRKIIHNTIMAIQDFMPDGTVDDDPESQPLLTPKQMAELARETH